MPGCRSASYHLQACLRHATSNKFRQTDHRKNVKRYTLLSALPRQGTPPNAISLQLKRRSKECGRGGCLPLVHPPPAGSLPTSVRSSLLAHCPSSCLTRRGEYCCSTHPRVLSSTDSDSFILDRLKCYLHLAFTTGRLD